jgi:hypothetical protein
MKSQPEADFLRGIEPRGIAVDPAYPKSAILRFRNAEPDARFWIVPDEPERRPYFIATMLELMGSWASCFAWRHMGSWRAREHINPLRINDCVEFTILNGIGIPTGTADIIEFTRDDMFLLVTLLFATSIFGWSVGEDLYVVPDHGQYILKTDHHGVIHVEFRRPADVDAWVSAMADRGFPLPDEPPDATFKSSGWMVQKS